MIFKNGSKDIIEPLLNELIKKSREEIGCLQYDIIHSKTDEGKYVVIERWDNQEALQAHTRQEFKHKITSKWSSYLL